ncbi:MAG: carboxypeptidase-like regulatory domain-containing protein [Candidatus Eisenbacteria bacterium]
MDWIRVYWPALIGVLVVILALVVLLSGGAARKSFRERNRDGIFLLALFGILLLLLAGSGAALRRSVGELQTLRESATRESEDLRRQSQEWSLRFSLVQAERDSLRNRREREEEDGEAVRLEGRVVREEGSAPVPDARVRVLRRDPTKHVKDRILVESLALEPDGRFSLEVPRLGERGVYRIEAFADGFETATLWVAPPDAGKPVEIRLVP